MNFLPLDNFILKNIICSLLAASVIILSLTTYSKTKKYILKSYDLESLTYLFYMNFVKVLLFVINVVLVLYIWGINILKTLSEYLQRTELLGFKDLVTLSMRLCFTVLIILLGKFLSTSIIKLFTKSKKNKLTPLASLFISKILNTGLILFWIFILLYIWGFDLTSVVAGLGLTGVVVAFAMKESLASVFAGFMIALKTPFELGDLIKVGNVTGSVTEVNLTSVILDTYDKIRIVLTNQQVWTGQIINYSHSQDRLLEIKVPLHYSTDIDVFRTLVLDELKLYDEIYINPEPRVYIPSFDNLRINAVIAFTVDNSNYFKYRDIITERVIAIMNANNIRFASQAIDINKQD